MKLTAGLLFVSLFVIVCAQPDRPRTRAISRGEITFSGNANFGETSRIRSRVGVDARSSRVEAKPSNVEAKPRFTAKSRETRVEPKPNVQSKPNVEAKPRFAAKPRETRIEAKPRETRVDQAKPRFEAKPIRVEPKPSVEAKPKLTAKPKAEDKPILEVKPKVEERFIEEDIPIEEGSHKDVEEPSLQTEGKPSIDVDDNTVTG
jgi:hypothetical protein